MTITADASNIIWMKTDEAPMLATSSWLPVVNAFTKVAGVTVELRDMSLAGRIPAVFPDSLASEQRRADHPVELRESPRGSKPALPDYPASVRRPLTLQAFIKGLYCQEYKILDLLWRRVISGQPSV